MTHTIPISIPCSRNFQTLVDAVQSDRVCLMSVFDSIRNEPATLICAVNIDESAEQVYEFVPLATLCDDNPYLQYIPPTADMEGCHGD